MRTVKRSVSYDGKTFKVKSDKIELPDFTQMERIAVLMWLSRHTYARGYSRSSHSLQGIGGAIRVRVVN